MIFELSNLRFKCGDSPVTFLECVGYIACVETLWDMLRTVGVPGDDMKEERLLTLGLVVWRHQALDQHVVIVDDLGRTPKA